jgi:hypothetical protein
MKTKHTAAAERLRDPAEFRRHVVIDVGGKPKLYREVETPWQQRDNLAADNGTRLAMGLPVKDGDVFQRVYLERSRGGSKTSDGVLRALSMLYGAPRLIRIVWAAGSREQASIALGIAEQTVRLNSFLRGTLEVQRNVIRNTKTGAELAVIAADEHTSYGLLLDGLFVDELANWKIQCQPFWETLFSGVDKKANAFLQIGTNAGVLNSWQWTIREAIRASPDWFFSRASAGAGETLLGATQLAAQKRILLPMQYRRLHENEWTQTSDESLPDFQHCINPSLRPTMTATPGAAYVGAIDVGAEHDRAAVSIMEGDAYNKKIRLTWSKSWPAPVNLLNLWQTVKALHGVFHCITWLADPWESRTAQQELVRLGVNVVLFPFTPQNNAKMATAMVTTITANMLELYHDEELIDDLNRISVVEKSGVLKLVGDRTARGHCDKAFTVAMAAVAAQELLDGGYSGEIIPAQALEHPRFINMEPQKFGIQIAGERMHLSQLFRRHNAPNERVDTSRCHGYPYSR